jgi:drug/metabolite transporter (DMT)-like permease
MNLEGAFGIVFTALLWGITDPLLKKFGTGFDKKSEQSTKPENSGFVGRVCREILFLLTNWKYVLTFCSNQLGSVTFLWTLARCQMSVAIPLTNSLKFVTTFVTGQFLGEKKLNRKSFFGICLILTGVCLQVYSKEQ